MKPHYITRDLGIEAVRDWTPASRRQHRSHEFDAKDIAAALAYAKYLRKKWAIEELNELRARNGLPIETLPVLLSPRGKHVYEAVERALGKEGHVPLRNTKRLEVIDRLLAMKAEVTR